MRRRAAFGIDGPNAVAMALMAGPGRMSPSPERELRLRPLKTAVGMTHEEHRGEGGEAERLHVGKRRKADFKSRPDARLE